MELSVLEEDYLNHEVDESEKCDDLFGGGITVRTQSQEVALTPFE
jgi:hypothetical protein